jgi:hypothetical protein
MKSVRAVTNAPVSLAERSADGCFTEIRIVPVGVDDLFFFFFFVEGKMMSPTRLLGFPRMPAALAALAITC